MARRPPARSRRAPPRRSWPRPSRPCPASGPGDHLLHASAVPAHGLPAGQLPAVVGRRTGDPGDAAGPHLPPPAQSRTGRALKWSVSALLITALGLGSWQLADTLLKREKDQDAPGNSQPAGGPKKHTGKALSVKGATEFSPLAEPFKEEDAHNVTDGSPSTAWVTGRFKGWPNFGNLPTRADGSGIIVDLRSTKDISGIQATMYRPGQTVEIRAAASSAANPTTLGDFSQRISKLGEAGDKLDVKLDQSVKSRYVLVHITKLASDGASDWFRGGISEIKIFS